MRVKHPTINKIDERDIQDSSDPVLKKRIERLEKAIELIANHLHSNQRDEILKVLNNV